MNLKSEQIVFIIKGFNLVLGFPNTQYHFSTKNYLPCLVIRVAFSIRRKGLYIYIFKHMLSLS